MSKEIPIRVQRKRTKGWRMPANTVYVGRPTIFGNPYHTSLFTKFTRADAVVAFEKYIDERPRFREKIKEELKGKNLACWCPLDKPCHGDVLLKIANE